MAKSKPKNKTKKTTKPRATSALPNGTPAWFTNARLHAWVLFALGFLLYANTLGHDYAQDDAIVITDNMFTTEGIAGIPGILQYDTFYGFFKEEGKANLVAGGRYRPLTLVMFAIEYQLFGEHPFIGHLVNALLYGLTGVVLYWLLLQLFRPKNDPAQAYFIALAAGLLFITHPIHTEAVANIKGRDEIVALLGSLAALYFSFRAYFAKKNLFQILAGVVFFLALLSKENAITVVVVAPFALYFFTKAKAGKIIAQTLPFALAAVIFLIIRFLIVGAPGGDPPMELMNNPFLQWNGSQYVPFTASERMATVLFTLGKYLQLLVFPHPLTHDYYPRHIGILSLGDWRVLLSLALYIGLGVYAILGLRQKNPISYGIWFYLLTLSIVSNIVFPIGTNMAERLLFMPSAGFAIAVAALMYHLTFKKKITRFKQLYPVLGVLIVVVVLFSIKTITRNPAWATNFTLFTTDINTSPNSAKLRNAVGGELVTQSVNEPNEQVKQAMLTEAAGHLQEAINIHPTYKNAYLLLGNCYNYLKQYDQAIANYRKALELDPGYEEAFTNLKVTLQQAGRFYGEEQGDLARAIQYLEQAYQMDANDYETVRLLGVAYGVGGNVQRAIEYFTKGVELAPNNAGAWYDLGSAYYNAQMPEQGNAYIQKALELNPNIVQERQQ